MSREQPIPEIEAPPLALVAQVLDNNYAVVINRGARDGIKQGQRFLIYELSPKEVLDPISGESLGHLEIVKGTGAVTHLQERMATVTSDRQTTTRRAWSPLMLQESVTHSEPFKSPKVGDRVKPI
jgi:hypothetical protein